MKTKNTDYEIAIAETLGTIAFKEGKPCIPACDLELLKLLQDKHLADPRNVEIMKAWIMAWNEASLSYQLSKKYSLN